MKAERLIDGFIGFFEQKDHRQIENVSLVPRQDSSVLFITAGMQSLVPYLLGKEHPLGRKLCGLQRILRTDDIDNVGDGFHHTFFEMLGNWSLGDYWKKEAIGFSFEFLTRELKLDQKKIFISCFEGDDQVEKDQESARAWQSVGIPKERITFLGRKDNWWGPVGETGPCGPDTEMFVDTGKRSCGKDCGVACNCGKYVEIWNNVFMQYNFDQQGQYEQLKQKNVDTGMGVERVTAITGGFKDDNYRTELFWPLIEKVASLSGQKYESKNYRSMRIIADHVRAAVFLLADGVVPANLGQGYVLRRLLRRAILQTINLGIKGESIAAIAPTAISLYQNRYPFLEKDQKDIIEVFREEEGKFGRLVSPSRLAKNKSGFEKIRKKGGSKMETIRRAANFAFDSLATTGIPYDFQLEQAKEVGIVKLKKGTKHFNKFFELKKQEHQKKSRASLKKRFAGGLSDRSSETIKLHTAAHLLHQALREILGTHVQQSGSNIAPERLRFDFTHEKKLTDEEIKRIEVLINQKVEENLTIDLKTMSLEEAEKGGALAFFADRYQDEVKVYFIGDFSKEVCGGPHVSSTKEIGNVKKKKQESIGAGKRRLYLVFNL